MKICSPTIPTKELFGYDRRSDVESGQLPSIDVSLLGASVSVLLGVLLSLLLSVMYFNKPSLQDDNARERNSHP